MTRFVEDPSALTTSYYATDEVAALTAADLADLQRLAREVAGPARFSLHASPTDDLHCMVILQPAGTYAQPRKHLLKAKSFHLVSGEMVVIAFEEDGEVRSLHRLATDETLVVRVAPGILHTNYSLSEQAVYHEVIAGPYERDSDDRRYAEFAPGGEDQAVGRAWVEAVIERSRPGLLARR